MKRLINSLTILSLIIILFTISNTTAQTNWSYEFSDDTWESDWFVSHGNFSASEGILQSTADCYILTDWGCWNSMWKNQSTAYGSWSFDINLDDASQYDVRPVYAIYFVGNGRDTINFHPEVGYNMRINVIQNKIVSSWRDPTNASANYDEGIYWPSTPELAGWLHFDIDRYTNGTINIIFNKQRIIQYNNNEVTTSEYLGIEAIQGVKLDNLSYSEVVPDRNSFTKADTSGLRLDLFSSIIAICLIYLISCKRRVFPVK